jgi:hypothetical protein
MSILSSDAENGPSQLWDVMRILSLSFDSESADIVRRFVVCTLGASLRDHEPKTF